MTRQQYHQLQNFIQRFNDEPPLPMPDLKSQIATPYNHNETLSDFIKFMRDERLVTGNYLNTLTAFCKTCRPKNFISKLNEEDCLSLLSGFVREDSIASGWLAMHIITGNVEAIIKRLKQLQP